MKRSLMSLKRIMTTTKALKVVQTNQLFWVNGLPMEFTLPFLPVPL